MKYYLSIALTFLCLSFTNAQPLLVGYTEITPDTNNDQTLNTNEYMEFTSGSFDYGDKSITLDNNSIVIIRSGVTLDLKNLSVKSTAILYVERGATVTVDEDFIVTDTGEAEVHSLYFILKSKIEAKDGGTVTGTGRLTYQGSSYEVDGGSSVCIGTGDPEFYDPDHASYGTSGTVPCDQNGNSAQFIADLPVEMIFFESNVSNGNVNLNWATATEVNASHFVVMRSTDKTNWEEIGYVEAGGNTNFRQDYSYTDSPVSSSGIYYYKLQQFDYDGQSEFFGPLTVSLNLSNGFSAQVHPNPTTSSLNLSIEGLHEGNQLSIAVIDKLGKAVYQENKEVGGNSLIYNVHQITDLNPGHYLLILTSGSQKITTRFIKQ
ncbi:T9SS type A sorting domain-containing protein [Flammeovirga yaeyamensis]|uniref:T9SS type A sorting domain-containing protein n=1 Tax=Flammeovirga yaeyamensis TaxID=367791 RepID=A0AAX1NBA1_9BACT|nr:T9SS type A sorting domain-containing protein [Flammeovirga yaeyamensis]MBB3697254.1 hypothetical protein [Flammeovirga yaeyamensis]NMF33912.1 T9SS type A sorting domain-containing protein [Flammeovirga yaeyamensis]QWG04828.1 T9SS type A sorting domain-containing protein [Flammeovirga yaeyamensis]